MDDFVESARLAAADEISFEEYERRTHRRWQWWANKLKAAWKPESWMGEDDIRQELLIAVWLAFYKFSPAKGTEPARFVEYAATRRVQKKVTHAAGMEQHRRIKRTRRFVAMDDAPEPHIPASQEVRVDLALVLEAFASLCVTDPERLAVQALRAELSLEGAAQAILQDPTAALACRVSNEVEALEVVRDSLGKLMERYQEEVCQ